MSSHLRQPKKISLVGRTIVEVRPMTLVELEDEGWRLRSLTPLVLILDNGTKVFAASDDEGNGAGVLQGVLRNGFPFRVTPERPRE